ncbi:MAG: molybdate ABC transporter permease subunit [Janthinobacterium lividum]
MVDYAPLWLSLKVAGWATVFSVLFGLPLAYLLGRVRFPGRGLLEGIALLPLVLPPTVLGYALLVGLGQRSPVGQWLKQIGHPLVFTWQGAAVAACAASLPLFITQARVAFAAIDADIIGAARTDGAGFPHIFRYILLPLARPGLIAGTTLAFARALGDFGATLMVAGDTPGQTQTMPLAIYDAVLSNDTHTALVFTLISASLCLIVCTLAARLGR